MMENRSYDHYFGDYPKGRGFNDHPADSLGVFAQNYPGGSSLVPPDVLLPFHLDSTAGLECTDDLTHDWGPQHLCWNDGTMDAFVSTHTSSQYEGANGAMTMGYYKREDLAFYYALGRRLHPLRRLSLLDPRPHAPQPADGQQRHDRPGGPAGRAGDRHQRDARHHVGLHVADDAGGAPGRRGLLEGLQPEQSSG